MKLVRLKITAAMWVVLPSCVALLLYSEDRLRVVEQNKAELDKGKKQHLEPLAELKSGMDGIGFKAQSAALETKLLEKRNWNAELESKLWPGGPGRIGSRSDSTERSTTRFRAEQEKEEDQDEGEEFLGIRLRNPGPPATDHSL